MIAAIITAPSGIKPCASSARALSKSTAIAVAVFFIATLILTSIGANKGPAAGVMDKLPAASASAPAVSAPASAASAPVQSSDIPK